MEDRQTVKESENIEERADLLICGGHVIDPAAGISKIMDVAVKDGIILAVGENLTVKTNKRLDIPCMTRTASPMLTVMPICSRPVSRRRWMQVPAAGGILHGLKRP